MKIIKALLGLIFFLTIFFVVVAFLTANTAVVVVDPLLWSAFSIKLGSFTVLTFIAGGLLGLLSAMLIILKQRRDKALLEKRLRNSARLVSGMGA